MSDKTSMQELNVWHGKCPECFGVGFHASRCTSEDADDQRRIMKANKERFGIPSAILESCMGAEQVDGSPPRMYVFDPHSDESIKATWDYTDSMMVDSHKCSKCGKKMLAWQNENPAYCSNCGSKFTEWEQE